MAKHSSDLGSDKHVYASDMVRGDADDRDLNDVRTAAEAVKSGLLRKFCELQS